MGLKGIWPSESTGTQGMLQSFGKGAQVHQVNHSWYTGVACVYIYTMRLSVYTYNDYIYIYVICTRSQLYALILTATHQLCLGTYFTNCCKKLYVEKTFRRLHPGIQFQKGIGRVSVDIYERSHYRSHHFRLDRFVGKNTDFGDLLHLLHRLEDGNSMALI